MTPSISLRDLIRLIENEVPVVSNPSPAKLHAMLNQGDVRLLWTPNQLYAWDAKLNNHLDMAEQLNLTQPALRFITILGAILVARAVDTDDQPVSPAQIHAALDSPTMRYFKTAIERGKMKLEIDKPD